MVDCSCASRSAPSAGASQTLKVGARILVVHLVRDARARRYVRRSIVTARCGWRFPRWGRSSGAGSRAERRWIEQERARLLRRTRRPSRRPSAPCSTRRARVELTARLRTLAAQHGFEAGRGDDPRPAQPLGSCSPRGDISLNWRLVTMPDTVRDYVLCDSRTCAGRITRGASGAHVAICPDWCQAVATGHGSS